MITSEKTCEELPAGAEGADAKTTSLRPQDTPSKFGEEKTEPASAISFREKEHQDSIATEKEMIDTLESLNGAAAVLKKSAGFVQVTCEARQEPGTVLVCLRQFVNASLAASRVQPSSNVSPERPRPNLPSRSAEINTAQCLWPWRIALPPIRFVKVHGVIVAKFGGRVAEKGGEIDAAAADAMQPVRSFAGAGSISE